MIRLLIALLLILNTVNAQYPFFNYTYPNPTEVGEWGHSIDYFINLLFSQFPSIESRLLLIIGISSIVGGLCFVASKSLSFTGTIITFIMGLGVVSGFLPSWFGIVLIIIAGIVVAFASRKVWAGD